MKKPDIKRRHSYLRLTAGGLLGLALSLLTAACGTDLPKAELVLRNGHFFTADEHGSEVTVLAIAQGRILGVGTEEEIAPFIGDGTRILDLKGRMAVPGFIESHAHFSGLGESQLSLNLMQADTWDDIVAMVEQAARTAQPDEWIVGRGWHQEKWSRSPEPNLEGFPYHPGLSRVSARNPVLLTHASGHALFANARAMEMAGVTAETPSPAGGEILHGVDGAPIGVFRETAQNLIYGAYQASLDALSAEQRDQRTARILQTAAEECLRKGITSFHDAGASFATIEAMKRLSQEDALGVRLYVMLEESDAAMAEHLSEYPLIGFADHFLTVRAIKRYADGALGSHGAWLLEPYTDLPASTGLNTTPLDSLAATANFAAEHGFQLCIHAIGDRANREVLNLYERTLAAHPEFQDPRWRIEHAQHLSPADIPRFAQLQVIAAMQGIHATSDGAWVPKRLGEERTREGAYVWRSLLDSGAVIVNGTDAPVEDVNPIPSFYASVTRRLGDGSEFHPEQKMSREEALRSYTIQGAYAAFEEDLKGSLTPGKVADITILSQDLLSVPDDQILQTQVDFTIVGGKIRYNRNQE